MHTNFYLLITIGVLAGFFMRPLNMFVFGKVAALVKYIQRKPLVILLMFASMLSALAVTISTIYLALKLSGFIPLAAHAPAFVVSFFVGGMLWVIYAKLFNRGCSIDL
ncbi:MAG: hypothetical protein GC149_01580 [Gammaproteobacteria bacterium]|nr:hypothetical protein [Gammaproteobacteria bacterium]